MPLNKTYDERTKKIAELIALSDKEEDLYFKKETYPCPVINISDEYLIYRLDNTRTNSSQPEFIEDNGLDSDYFDESRTEVPEVQDNQHELLWKEVDKPLQDSFEMHNGQTESILVNEKGVVINGNRRLRLMRERKHDLIKCAVVTDPNLEGKEFQIEAFLDMTPQTKKGYIWHAAARTMKKLHELGMSYDEIAEERGKATGTEVQILIKARELAAERLKNEGTPNKWSLVDKSETIYTYTAATKIRNPLHARAAELATIIADSASEKATKGRAYDINRKVLANPELASEVLSDLAPKVQEVEHPITGEKEINSTFNEVEIFKKIKNNTDYSDKIIESIHEKINEKEDVKASIGAKKQLQQKVNNAAKHLEAAVDLTDQTSLETDGIQDKINHIRENLELIEKYINK